MQKIIAILLLSLTSTAYALPNCPSDPSVRWHNCFGAHIFGQDSEWAGDKYVGEWKDDKRHGQGTYTFANGDKYVGELKDGNYHGQGTYTYANGAKYVGEYKDDNYHGQGTYTFANGDKYVGEWRDDKKHGQGTVTFASGAKYVGEIKDGKRHGQGTYTYANGTKENGYFMNDEYVPDICEDMGLRQGTPEFGQCVLKLIDKL